MPYRVLYPAMRWPDNREIEIASMGDLGRAEFCDGLDQVTEEQWQSCDAIISVLDIPNEYRDQMGNCKIFVTPKVGFDLATRKPFFRERHSRSLDAAGRCGRSDGIHRTSNDVISVAVAEPFASR